MEERWRLEELLQALEELGLVKQQDGKFTFLDKAEIELLHPPTDAIRNSPGVVGKATGA